MRTTLLFIIAAALLTFPISTFGQDADVNAEKGPVSFVSPVVWFWYVGINGGITGIPVIGEAQSFVTLTAQMWYFSMAWNRYDDGHRISTPLYVPIDPRTLYKESCAILLWEFALGIVPNRNPSDNLFELFFNYIGFIETLLKDISPNDAYIFASNVIDNGDAIISTACLGLSYDDSSIDSSTLARSGLSIEALYRFGFTYNTDDGRIGTFDNANLVIKGFVSLIDAGGITLGVSTRFIFDALWGDAIPQLQYMNLGTRYDSGLYNHLRGLFSPAHYDYDFKFVNNIDLRLQFTTLFGKQFVPGIVLYCDTLAYSENPFFSDRKTPLFIAGAGVTFNLDLFGIKAEISVYGGYNFDSKNIQMFYWYGQFY